MLKKLHHRVPLTCGLLAGLGLLASVSPLQAVTLSDLNDKTFVWSRQWVEGTPTDDSDSEIIHLNANGTTQDWWNDDYDQFGNRLPPVADNTGTWSLSGDTVTFSYPGEADEVSDIEILDSGKIVTTEPVTLADDGWDGTEVFESWVATPFETASVPGSYEILADGTTLVFAANGTGTYNIPGQGAGNLTWTVTAGELIVNFTSGAAAGARYEMVLLARSSANVLLSVARVYTGSSFDEMVSLTMRKDSYAPSAGEVTAALSGKTIFWTNAWDGVEPDVEDIALITFNSNGTYTERWNDDYDQFGNRLPPVSGTGTWTVIGNVLRLDNNPADDVPFYLLGSERVLGTSQEDGETYVEDLFKTAAFTAQELVGDFTGVRAGESISFNANGTGSVSEDQLSENFNWSITAAGALSITFTSGADTGGTDIIYKRAGSTADFIMAAGYFTNGSGTLEEMYALNLSRNTATALSNEDIVIDFGGIGLWAWMNDASWLKLNNASPAQMITADMDGNGQDEVIAEFPAAGGIFVKYNGGGWSQLHGSSPDSMAAGDLDDNGKDDVVIDFGSIGLWARMNDASWLKLNNNSPDRVVAGDMDGNGADDVIADFGSTLGGLYVKRNLGGWSQLHNFSSEALAVGDLDNSGKDDVIIDFGGIGLWARMNDASWLKLHNSSPELVTSGDVDGNGADDVLATFASAAGLWVKKNLGGWSSISTTTPEQVDTGDVDASGTADIVADFGASGGVTGLFVRRDEGAWSKLHNNSPEDLVPGDLD